MKAYDISASLNGKLTMRGYDDGNLYGWNEKKWNWWPLGGGAVKSLSSGR